MSQAEADLLARLHALKPSSITSLDPRQPAVGASKQSSESDRLAETKPARDADELLARFQRFRQATPSRSGSAADGSEQQQQQQTEEARGEDLEQAPARTADELLSRFQRLHGRRANAGGSDVVVVGDDESEAAKKPLATEVEDFETADDLSELSKDDAAEGVEDDWEMILAEHKQQMQHDGDDSANVKGLMREADAALKQAAVEQGAVKDASSAEQDCSPSANGKTSVTKPAANQNIKTGRADKFDSDARELDFTDIGRAVDSHQTEDEKAGAPVGPAEDDEATAYIREALERASLDKDDHESAANGSDRDVSDDGTGGGDTFALPSAPTAAPVTPSSKSNDETLLPSAPSFAPSARVGTVQKPSLGLDNDNENAEVDSWCIICQDDATLQCLGCDSDLYCTRCWNEGHRGEDAGYEQRRHRAVHYEKDGGGKEVKGKTQRRKVAA